MLTNDIYLLKSGSQFGLTFADQTGAFSYSGQQFGFGTGVQTGARMVVSAHISGAAAIIYQGILNQQGNLAEWVDSSRTKVAFVTASGGAYFSGNVGIGTTSPTNLLSLGGNAARIFWMERHTTANTAGNTLTIQAGGATSAATDKAGGNLILSPGASTGTGRTQVNIKGYTVATATGTSDNTQLDREIIGGFKALSNNTNTAIVNCTMATETVVAGVVRYAVEVFDGTDVQIEEGCVAYHATNKASTPANNTTVKFGNQQAVTAGTLTVTWTITAANPAVLTINANSSLTPSAGYPRLTYNIDNLTQQAVAIQ